MSSSLSTDTDMGSAEDEIARLRAQVAQLERELAETEAWANRTVVQAQAKTYWLDRWGIDLNALMQRPAADHARAWARRVRSLYRLAVRLRRRVGS
jgi:hypothetical protein